MIRDYKTFESEEFVIDLSEELNKVALSLDPLSTGNDFTIFPQSSINTLNRHAPMRKKQKRS